MATLVGASSEPMLDGVLVTEWKLPCVRHEASGRGSYDGGEPMDVTDIVSKSGVLGSR